MIAPERPIRILVVDDHPVTRLGLIALLASQPGFVVVAEAGSVAEAVEAFRRTLPDVMVLDMRLPDGSALDALPAVRRIAGDARVLILSGMDGEEHAYRALQIGVTGYLTKKVAAQELVAAVRAVAAGTRVLGSDVAAAVGARVGQPDLTPRELDVLRLLVEGRSNPEIGLVLGVSTGTIRTHVAHILEKLGATDRTEAATMAHRRGIV